ncbi:MAG: radical SAM protein [Candidatus Nanoarchaeia archaeon]|nr:radical SAM protein [Candidatus Nanoarchaeia archaeon]
MAKILLLIPPSKKDLIRDTQYGCWHEKKFLSYSWPPLTLYQIAAILRKKHEVLVLDGGLEGEKSFGIINRFNPEFVVFAVGTFTLDDDLEFLKNIKAKTIVFGQHATIRPNEIINKVDYLIRGEPEAVLEKFFDSYPDEKKLARIKGVCFKKHISEPVLVEDLDSLPFALRDVRKAKMYSNPFGIHEPFATVIVSRGCPFNCIFCTVPSLYGKTFRVRSVENVMGELRLLKKQGFKEIFFRDENLTLRKSFIKELCDRMIKERLNFTWMCNSRVDTLDDEILSLMKKSGCHLIKFGVESARQEILDKIGKGTRIESIRSAFRLCKKYDIDTVAHFMIGNYGDTNESIKDTINFAVELDPLFASFDVVLKYPGTKIENLKLTDLNGNELKAYHDLAFKTFYLRPKLILKHMFHLKSFTEFKKKVISSFELWRELL